MLNHVSTSHNRSCPHDDGQYDHAVEPCPELPRLLLVALEVLAGPADLLGLTWARSVRLGDAVSGDCVFCYVPHCGSTVGANGFPGRSALVFQCLVSRSLRSLSLASSRATGFRRSWRYSISRREWIISFSLYCTPVREGGIKYVSTYNLISCLAASEQEHLPLGRSPSAFRNAVKMLPRKLNGSLVLISTPQRFAVALRLPCLRHG